MKFKKIIAAMLTICLLMLFCSCGVTSWQESSGGDTSSEVSEISQVDKSISDKNYKDTLSGLCEYLAAAGIVSGESEAMEAEMIGAESGVKYKTETATVELYEYDLKNLNEIAQDVISSVKENGSFTLMEYKADAVMSQNGKYPMVYKSTKDSDPNAQVAKDLFANFKK
jgi:hypothetical protein